MLLSQRLGLRSGPFPSGFPSKTVHAPVSLPVCVTCPSHLILLHLITRVRLQSILGNQEASENETLYILSVDGTWFRENTATVHKWVFAGRISIWKLGKEQLPSCVHYPFFLMWWSELENGSVFVVGRNALSVLVRKPSKGYLKLGDKMHECQRIWAQFPLLRKRWKSLRLNLHYCNPSNWRIWPRQTQFSLPAGNMWPKQVPRSDRWKE